MDDEPRLRLDNDARRALWQVYSLLLRLADEEAADSKDLPQDPELSTAQDGAQKAPSQTGA